MTGKHNDSKRISPLFNDAFLRIFGGQDSKPVARSLANAILREVGLPELGEIERIEADSATPGTVSLKSTRCDVVMVLEGRIVDLEAQRHVVNVDNKSMLYAAKLLVDNTPRGRDAKYVEMPQVVVITLLSEAEAFEDDCFVSPCRMQWDRGGAPAEGTDRVMFVLVELEKVARLYNKVTSEVLADELTAWLYVLARGYRDEEEVEEIVQSIESIEKFAEMYGLAIDDPDIKRQYDLYQESILEQNEIEYEAEQRGLKRGEERGLEIGMKRGEERGLKLGEERGLKLGEERGIERERERIVENLRKLGMSEDQISAAIS